MEITVKYQTEYSTHTFDVVNADKLHPIEVWTICQEMNETAILVTGKYYQVQ